MTNNVIAQCIIYIRALSVTICWNWNDLFICLSDSQSTMRGCVIINDYKNSLGFIKRRLTARSDSHMQGMDHYNQCFIIGIVQQWHQHDFPTTPFFVHILSISATWLVSFYQTLIPLIWTSLFHETKCLTFLKRQKLYSANLLLHLLQRELLYTILSSDESIAYYGHHCL